MKVKPFYLTESSKPSFYLDEYNNIIDPSQIEKKDIELILPENITQKNKSIKSFELFSKPNYTYYACGNVDLQKSHTSFAGVDIRIYYKDNLEWKILNTVQSLSYKGKRLQNRLWSYDINLSTIRLNNSFINQNSVIEELFAFGANEYGQCSIVVYMKDLHLIEFQTAFSVQDITVNEYMSFTTNNLQTQFTKEENDFYISIVQSFNKGK